MPGSLVPAGSMRWSEYRDHHSPGQQHGLVRAVRLGYAEWPFEQQG